MEAYENANDQVEELEQDVPETQDLPEEETASQDEAAVSRSADTTGSFESISSRLDEIVAAVRSKDVSIEHSLDLLDEAIELGSSAVEMVDSIASIAGVEPEDELDTEDGSEGAVVEEGEPSAAEASAPEMDPLVQSEDADASASDEGEPA